MNSTVKKIAVSAMMAALICIATMLRVPLPAVGYVNLGDAFVLLAGCCLPMPYGILAAGIGSGMADLLSGYAMYIPVTFAIKGLMAFLMFAGQRVKCCSNKRIIGNIVGATAAELTMVLGYYVFEGIMFGFVPMLVNIPYNALQGIVGAVAGILLIRVFNKTKIFMY